jgi:hypothetical protein
MLNEGIELQTVLTKKEKRTNRIPKKRKNEKLAQILKNFPFLSAYSI